MSVHGKQKNSGIGHIRLGWIFTSKMMNTIIIHYFESANDSYIMAPKFTLY